MTDARARPTGVARPLLSGGAILALRLSGTSFLLTAALVATGVASAQVLSSDSPIPAVAAPQPGQDTAAVEEALRAAKSGDGARVQAVMATTADPLARKIALWALADATPDWLNWAQADEARRELTGWPRPSRRQVAAEKLIGGSGLSPHAIVAWFGDQAPLTPQGAMALASALRADGQARAAGEVIRRAWRTLQSDSATQQDMRARFADVLTTADDVAREDFLLYGPQDQTAADLLPLLPPDRQAVAQARMALKRRDPNAPALIAALPVADQTDPGIIYERLVALHDSGDVYGALSLIGYLPAELPSEAAADKLWRHGSLVIEALQMGDSARAYQAATHAGLSTGIAAAEAQFFAGWIALSRLKDPARADAHFARLATLSQSPITQARALYWRGRAAEAAGDPVAAELFYAQAARHQTTFYGQLAAARAGQTKIVLGHDPVVTPAARAAFEANDAVAAARLLARIGNHEGFRTFVTGLSESLPDAVSEAQLVDLAAEQGEQELAMRVVRNAAKRGFILPERGYPIRMPPTDVSGAPETAFILGIVRQESSFDPMARSGTGALGMMQLMPATARGVARRSGLGPGRLEDPDYNMRVGSAFLGQLVDQFSGSYLLAAAAYNAGPGRPNQWTNVCGDPRGSDSDPLDFVECIPFSETRDYVMRVLEATQVYRARLNGGEAPLTLKADLKRGVYGYSAPATAPSDAVAGSGGLSLAASPGGR
jgi:soluble lytic murein transglycosylase